MRMSRIILSLLLSLPLLAGCRGEREESAPQGRVTLRWGLQEFVGAEVSRSAAGEETIAAVWYAIADADGRVLHPAHHSLAPDLSGLTVEGLKAGDYNVVVLATTAENPRASVGDPATLAATWLRHGDSAAPLDETWFYKNIALHIGPDQRPVEQRIVLERCVGRVDVDLAMSSDYIERFIRRVEVTFDRADGFYASMSADGAYSSAGGAGTVDVTAARSFLSLPSREALAGKVVVTALRSDGSEFTSTYRFEGCRVEAGRIARIAVEYRHPEDESGLIYLREDDFARFGTDTMFLAREPQSVFYDESRRSFRVDSPLQAAIDGEHRLRVRFFSPLPVRDVTVKCRFNKVSMEFFELARFDMVYPFMEASFPIPVTQEARSYTTSDGRRATIPAQPALSNDDVTLEIVCDDPFMRKIATIESSWYIRFSPFAADEGHAYWRHMTPELCRHGVALVLNMAYMFSSEEFNKAMDDYEGKLLDNQLQPIDLDILRRTIRTHAGLVLGHVTGVGGLGGGTTYGLADYCYREVYWDWEANPLANPHTYVRQAMFHEYGHCLGYSHESTMTYGDQWTVLCATVFVNLGSQGKLPVCSKSVIASLPM